MLWRAGSSGPATTTTTGAAAVAAAARRGYAAAPGPGHGASAGGGAGTRTCWRCHGETGRASVVCEHGGCAAIQPVDAQATYFDVLVGGPAAFGVDPARLRRRFLALQQAVHPDSVAQHGEPERGFAAAQSAWVNHAYATLRDPLHRAHYMLRLCAREIGEGEQATDPELLEQIMDAREELEAATTDEQIAELRRRNDAGAAAAVAGLARAFDAGDLDGARRLTQRLQYLRRAAQAIDRRHS